MTVVAVGEQLGLRVAQPQAEVAQRPAVLALGARWGRRAPHGAVGLVSKVVHSASERVVAARQQDFTGGTSSTATAPASAAGASMGPPEFTGGNVERWALSTLQGYALQWGPPELPGGNWARRAARWAQRATLQWGRRNYPAETAARAARR